MNAANLIKMANQIGAFFEAMPDHEQAVADIVSHLKNSWDPRMRQALLQDIATHGDSMLKPIVREAVAQLRVTSNGEYSKDRDGENDLFAVSPAPTFQPILADQSRSKITAMPWPPPMHMVTSA